MGSETLMTRCFYGTSLHCHEEHQLIRTERNLRLTCPIFPLKSSPSMEEAQQSGPAKGLGCD
ncbi:hypothetical protein EK904_000921 [Melospiza melodia maxima]|nr:hypothetical protein EK904_000921 [Melospiza melodia maxima]